MRLQLTAPWVDDLRQHTKVILWSRYLPRFPSNVSKVIASRGPSDAAPWARPWSSRIVLPVAIFIGLRTMRFHIVQRSWIKATNRAKIAMIASADKDMINFVDF
jgi:hypothetical protein